MKDTVKDLQREDTNNKIKELAEKADMCFFTTNLTQLPLSTRPMSTREVDEDGNVWFFSRKDSDKNKEIEADNRVQLFYSNHSNYEFLTLFGKATIIKDDEKAKQLWSSIAKTWFNEGYDDPELTLIKVEPQDGHYWDTKDGKLVSLFKMLAGAVTGKEMNNSVEGDLTK